MSVFVHAQGMKTVHAGEGGVKKWQNEKKIADSQIWNITLEKLC